MSRRASPAAVWRPSVRSSIPRRKSPMPPRRAPITRFGASLPGALARCKPAPAEPFSRQRRELFAAGLPQDAPHVFELRDTGFLLARDTHANVHLAAERSDELIERRDEDVSSPLE